MDEREREWRSHLERVRRGDEGALRWFADRYYEVVRCRARGKIFPHLRARVGESDVVQDAWVQIVGSIKSFRGSSEAEFEEWLRTILDRQVNETVRYHGVQKRDPRREEGSPGDSSGPENSLTGSQTSPSQAAARNELLEQLERVRGLLPPRQRKAMDLKYLEQKTLREIASELKISEAAAAGLLKRALEQLRRDMDS